LTAIAPGIDGSRPYLPLPPFRFGFVVPSANAGFKSLPGSLFAFLACFRSLRSFFTSDPPSTLTGSPGTDGPETAQLAAVLYRCSRTEKGWWKGNVWYKICCRR